MRTIPLLAAALVAASGASAQVYGANCRGRTLSELANCVAASTPPAETAVLPELEEAAPMGSRTIRPTSLGGALQPSNLRRSPPLVGRSATPGLTIGALSEGVTGFDPLRDLSEDPTSPLYGLGRSGREALGLDPMAGTGIGTYRGMPRR